MESVLYYILDPILGTNTTKTMKRSPMLKVLKTISRVTDLSHLIDNCKNCAVRLL